MARHFNGPPSPERLGRSKTWIDALGIRWVGTPTPRSRTFSNDYGSQEPLTFSEVEADMYPPQEMEQAPFPYDDRGPLPWGFPSPPPPRLLGPRVLAKLIFPNDVPVQALERMKYRQGFKKYVNYPTRLFHLRPHTNLGNPEDLSWETTFLWHKVSSSLCMTDWVEDFPYPALDMPLPYFPEAILRHGQTMRISKVTPDEALEFAAAVLNSTARGPSDPEPNFHVEWKDIRKMATSVVRQLERRGDRGAAAMAASMREHQRAMREYDSFFRFRDWSRRPTGMGFRGSRDMFFLDDEYLTDFLNRAGEDDGAAAASVRMRPDVKLIPFLASADAAKVTTLMVSAAALRDPEGRAYLCYAIARTFPNLERLRLASVAAHHLNPTPPERWFRTAGLARLARDEVRRSGGSSYLPRARDDAEAHFDLANMSAALTRATGAHAHGWGRALAGRAARTPLVAYGVGAGLLHDPEPRAGQPPQTPAGGDPPFVAAVQHVLAAAFGVVARRRDAAAAAEARRAAGWRTMLPRPVPGGPAWGASSAARSYRRPETRALDFRFWAREHIARERRGRRHGHAGPGHFSSEAVPCARVEASVLIYDRDAYDRNIYNGWMGFGPGVHLSYYP